MTERHYTAWMANDPSVLMGDCMDITILEDEIIAYRQGDLIDEYDETGELTLQREEIPVWESRGAQMFYAETTVDAREGDAEDGIREAEALMEKAGWKVVGDWEATDNSYIATVEYVGEYRHVIEQTNNAEDPTWYEVIRGDQAEEHDGIPEEYGLIVLENYWPDNGLEVPPLADEYGNPYFRVVVRTQDDEATLTVVESSAAGMTPAAFKVTREFLGLSDGWLADHLKVSSRTVRNWEAGKYSIPDGVAAELDALKRQTQQKVDGLVAKLRNKPAPRLVTYRNDTDYKAAQPDSEFPATWQRAVVARVALEVPGLGIDYASGDGED